VARLPLSDVPGDPYYRLLGHRPEILAAWSSLDTAFVGGSSTLPATLKEEVRRVLSQEVGCRYCASLGKPDAGHNDPKVALAVAFTELVLNDQKAIDDAMFAVLREEFSDEQILELCSWICFKYGSNMLGSILRLEPATPDEVKAYNDWVAAAPV
jgi:alkylhydroperoxidase family enzyme